MTKKKGGTYKKTSESTTAREGFLFTLKTEKNFETGETKETFNLNTGVTFGVGLIFKGEITVPFYKKVTKD